MDYRVLFYWLSIADNARSFFLTFTIIFTIMVLISTICYFVFAYTESHGGQTDEDKVAQRLARKWMWYSYPFFILFWGLFVFTPTRKDALLIVAGGSTLNYLTQDSTARQLPKDLMSFVSTELKQMASEAKVSLELNKTKEQIIEEAKKLSSDELLEKMRIDSNYRKLLTEQ